MAHNLENRNGKTSFASTQVAWHGLGQIVKEAMTSKQAIELAGLGYEVIKVPMNAEVAGVGQFPVPDKFATVRTDNNEVLGVVGTKYTIVQNKDAFLFFDSIVGQGQAIFETAGVLGRGERIFVSAKMPNYIRIAGTDDLTEVYVILTSSHDGSGSVIAAVTPIRIVCANTLRLGLQNAVNKVAIRHTANVENNLMQAHKVLDITNKYTLQLNEMFNQLSLKRVSDQQVKELVGELFKGSKEEESTRAKNIQESVLTSYYTGIGQEKILGTAWGVLNGITHFTSHAKDYKNQDAKMESLVMDGTASKINDEAFKMLVAL